MLVGALAAGCTHSLVAKSHAEVSETPAVSATSGAATPAASPAPVVPSGLDDREAGYDWIYRLPSYVSLDALVADGRGGALFTAFDGSEPCSSVRVGRLDAEGHELWNVAIEREAQAAALCFGPQDETMVVGTADHGDKHCSAGLPPGQSLFLTTVDAKGAVRDTKRFATRDSIAEAVHRTPKMTFLVGETSNEVRAGDRVLRHPKARPNAIPADGVPFFIALNSRGGFLGAARLRGDKLYGSTVAGDLLVYASHERDDPEYWLQRTLLIGVDAAGVSRFEARTDVEYEWLGAVTQESFDAEVTGPSVPPHGHKGPFAPYSRVTASWLYHFDRDGEALARRPLRMSGVEGLLDGLWEPAGKVLGDAPASRCSSPKGDANAGGERLVLTKLFRSTSYALLDPTGRVILTREVLAAGYPLEPLTAPPTATLALGDDGSVLEASVYDERGLPQHYIAKVKRPR